MNTDPGGPSTAKPTYAQVRACVRQLLDDGLHEDKRHDHEKRLRAGIHEPLLRLESFRKVVTGLDLVVTAVDEIDPVLETVPVTIAESRSKKVLMLRDLVGISTKTAHLNWGERQQHLAMAAYVSFRTIQRNETHRVIDHITERLLARDEELRKRGGPSRVPMLSSGHVVYERQADVELDLLRYIRSKSIGEALFYSFSTATSGNLIRAATANPGWTVRVLVSRPRLELPLYDLENLQAAVPPLVKVLAGAQNLQVRAYSTPAAMRAQLIGEHIFIGSYSHGRKHLSGHNMPFTGYQPGTEGSRVQIEWFRREFETAWGEAVDLNSVLHEYTPQSSGMSSESDSGL